MLFQVNKNPSIKELRQFGWTLVIGFGFLGGVLYWKGKLHGAFGLWGAGVTLGSLALLIPSAAKVLYKGWMGWAFITGTLITRIILVLLFFGVITPVAVLFRCMGRDVLRLKRNSGTGSYWSDHRKIPGRGYYQRLF
jgi:hypothetical protein